MSIIGIGDFPPHGIVNSGYVCRCGRCDIRPESVCKLHVGIKSRVEFINTSEPPP